MKILVVSCSPWRDDNNIGNSYSNIFGGMQNVEIAHICCGSGVPKTDLVKKHLHINEKNIIKNMINKKNKCCYEVISSTNKDSNAIGSKSGLFDFVKVHRFPFLFLLRDIIWSFQNWKCDELKEFVDEFKPDIIFAHFLDRGYLNDMILFLKEYTQKPVIVYAWDDVYSLKQLSLSPLYWMNRLLQRKKLRRVSEISSRMYVISEYQKKEYEKEFHRECTIIYKGYDFNTEPQSYSMNAPLKLVYTGIIGCGRWKSLALIGTALHRMDPNAENALLYLYTATPMSNKMKHAMNINNIKLMGRVPAEQIPTIQGEADILIHVESFDLKDRLKVRLSFSTKLVDYFNLGKCIFAVGSKDVASMNYLIKNKAAVVATNNNQIRTKLERLIHSPDLMKKYGKMSWECGRKNHQIAQIQATLMQDFNDVTRKE